MRCLSVFNLKITQNARVAKNKKRKKSSTAKIQSSAPKIFPACFPTKNFPSLFHVLFSLHNRREKYENFELMSAAGVPPLVSIHNRQFTTNHCLNFEHNGNRQVRFHQKNLFSTFIW